MLLVFYLKLTFLWPSPGDRFLTGYHINLLGVKFITIQDQPCQTDKKLEQTAKADIKIAITLSYTFKLSTFLLMLNRLMNWWKSREEDVMTSCNAEKLASSWFFSRIYLPSLNRQLTEFEGKRKLSTSTIQFLWICSRERLLCAVNSPQSFVSQ